MSAMHGAAIAFLLLLVPCGAAAIAGGWLQRIVGLVTASSLVVMLLVVLSVAFERTAFLDLPLALTLLSFGAGLVFVRFEEKAE